MRRISVLLLVMAMALVIASPVGAKKPPKDDQPLGGITCSELPADPGHLQTGEVGLDEDHFFIELSGRNVWACYDVMAAEGKWTVTIEEATGVRFLRVLPRDSIAPGDSCGGREFRFNRDVPTEFVLPHPDDPSQFDGDIEGAYVNSCGTSFGELIEGEYFGDVRTDIPSPLAFQVDMTGSGDAVLKLRVDLP